MGQGFGIGIGIAFGLLLVFFVLPAMLGGAAEFMGAAGEGVAEALRTASDYTKAGTVALYGLVVALLAGLAAVFPGVFLTFMDTLNATVVGPHAKPLKVPADAHALFNVITQFMHGIAVLAIASVLSMLVISMVSVAFHYKDLNKRGFLWSFAPVAVMGLVNGGILVLLLN